MKIVKQLVDSVTKPDSLFLDIGCGAGELLAYAKALGAVPVGIDVSLSYTKRARKQAENVVVADIEALPFKNRSFGIVLCADVIEHARHFDAAADELFRVADKVLLLTTPCEGITRGLLARILSVDVERWDRLVGHISIMPLHRLLPRLQRKGWHYLKARTFHVTQPYLDRFASPRLSVVLRVLEELANMLFPWHGTISAIAAVREESLNK